MQQFCITVMIILSFSIIVLGWFLFYSVSDFAFLGVTYFKEHVSAVASEYKVCDTETLQWRLDYDKHNQLVIAQRRFAFMKLIFKSVIVIVTH